MYRFHHDKRITALIIAISLILLPLFFLTPVQAQTACITRQIVLTTEKSLTAFTATFSNPVVMGDIIVLAISGVSNHTIAPSDNQGNIYYPLTNVFVPSLSFAYSTILIANVSSSGSLTISVPYPAGSIQYVGLQAYDTNGCTLSASAVSITTQETIFSSGPGPCIWGGSVTTTSDSNYSIITSYAESYSLNVTHWVGGFTYANSNNCYGIFCYHYPFSRTYIPTNDSIITSNGISTYDSRCSAAQSLIYFGNGTSQPPNQLTTTTITLTYSNPSGDTGDVNAGINQIVAEIAIIIPSLLIMGAMLYTSFELGMRTVGRMGVIFILTLLGETAIGWIPIWMSAIIFIIAVYVIATSRNETIGDKE